MPALMSCRRRFTPRYFTLMSVMLMLRCLRATCGAARRAMLLRYMADTDADYACCCRYAMCCAGDAYV